MARASETSSKKENAKRKSLKKQEKQQKKELRKSSSDKGKSLDEMLVYVDENGNLSDTPPGERKAAPADTRQTNREQTTMKHRGILERFNEAKGYGFIKDQLTRKTIFVHVHQIEGTVQVNDMLEFEVQEGAKGASAVKVRKISI